MSRRGVAKGKAGAVVARSRKAASAFNGAEQEEKGEGVSGKELDSLALAQKYQLQEIVAGCLAEDVKGAELQGRSAGCSRRQILTYVSAVNKLLETHGWGAEGKLATPSLFLRHINAVSGLHDDVHSYDAEDMRNILRDLLLGKGTQAVRIVPE